MSRDKTGDTTSNTIAGTTGDKRLVRAAAAVVRHAGPCYGRAGLVGLLIGLVVVVPWMAGLTGLVSAATGGWLPPTSFVVDGWFTALLVGAGLVWSVVFALVNHHRHRRMTTCSQRGVADELGALGEWEGWQR